MYENINIQAYFFINTPPEIRNVMIQAADSLRRGGVNTMSQLCDAPLDILAEMPDINGETIDLILLLCEKYISEHGSDAKGCDSS